MSDKVTLTDSQFDELVEQYVEIVVDRMNHDDFVEFVIDSLTHRFGSMSQTELKDYIIEMEHTFDNLDSGQELYDELVDNVTNEIAPSTVTITDDNYADKVDTLVSNMVASDDKEFTHDSEGC